MGADLHARHLRVLERGCLGKTAWTATGARNAALRMRTNGQPVVPYRCALCSRWHMGHTPDPVGMVALAAAVRDLDEPRAGPDPIFPAPRKPPLRRRAR